jgi:hypothetical protein
MMKMGRVADLAPAVDQEVDRDGVEVGIPDIRVHRIAYWRRKQIIRLYEISLQKYFYSVSQLIECYNLVFEP